jgi:hypothetical protein
MTAVASLVWLEIIANQISTGAVRNWLDHRDHEDTNMRPIHRPAFDGLVYGSDLIEIDADGRETKVPRENICLAMTTIVENRALPWVSADESNRVERLLKEAAEDAYEAWEAGEREDHWTETELVAFMAAQGYSKLSMDGICYDDVYFEDRLLFKNKDGKFVTVVMTWEEYQQYDGRDLNKIGVITYDEGIDRHIIRLQSRHDVSLARKHKLLCRDGLGDHVQVKLYRSTRWLCVNEQGDIDERKLLKQWRRQVRADVGASDAGVTMVVTTRSGAASC